MIAKELEFLEKLNGMAYGPKKQTGVVRKSTFYHPRLDSMGYTLPAVPVSLRPGDTTNVDWRLAWHYLRLSNSPRADGILPSSVASDSRV